MKCRIQLTEKIKCIFFYMFCRLSEEVAVTVEDLGTKSWLQLCTCVHKATFPDNLNCKNSDSHFVVLILQLYFLGLHPNTMACCLIKHPIHMNIFLKNRHYGGEIC